MLTTIVFTHYEVVCSNEKDNIFARITRGLLATMAET